MDIEEIRIRLKEIAKADGDDEAQHICEDALAWDFIRHVAKSSDAELAEIAKAVLESQELDFARWCA